MFLEIKEDTFIDVNDVQMIRLAADIDDNRCAKIQVWFGRANCVELNDIGRWGDDASMKRLREKMYKLVSIITQARSDLKSI